MIRAVGLNVTKRFCHLHKHDFDDLPVNCCIRVDSSTSMKSSLPDRLEQHGDRDSLGVTTLSLEQLSLAPSTSSAGARPVTVPKWQPAAPPRRLTPQAPEFETKTLRFTRTHLEDIGDYNDARFTPVLQEDRQSPGITVTFRPTCKERSFWRVNPNSLADEVLAIAQEDILSSRITKAGSLLVTVSSRPAANRLLFQTRLSGVDVETDVQTCYWNNLGKIRGVPLEYLDNDLLEYLKEEGVVGVQRQTAYERHGDGSSTPHFQGSVILSFARGISMPPRVRLGFTSYFVEEYFGAPVRCFKCQRFGHIARNCRFARQCKVCSGSHYQNECTSRSEPRCANCGGLHTATFSGCPCKLSAAAQRKEQILKGRRLPSKEAHTPDARGEVEDATSELPGVGQWNHGGSPAVSASLAPNHAPNAPEQTGSLSPAESRSSQPSKQRLLTAPPRFAKGGSSAGRFRVDAIRQFLVDRYLEDCCEWPCGSMKVSVRIRGEWLAVPCRDGRQTVQWLGEEALRRYVKLQPSSYLDGRSEKIFEIRKTRGGAILDGEDVIKNVLDDNEFVSVVLDTDRPSPVLGPAEITYIPEQVPGKFKAPSQVMTIDGNNLTPEDLLELSKGKYRIQLSSDSLDRVKKAREMLEAILKENKVAYGLNTGFGKFARVVIPDHSLLELQENLVRSHSAGVGNPLSPEKTRMLLALRINVLAKGYSGISTETLLQLVDAFNASCLSWVPEQGTVGASGDLAPLAHLALGLIGEGKMWSPETGWGDAKYVLESHKLTPIKLKPKEGLCLLNGTQLITSIGAEAVERATILSRQADVVAALTLEVLKGTTRAFESDIQKIRPHWGQGMVAKRLRALLHSETFRSEIAESHRFCNRVQDAYTLRCCPQVHGIVHDTIDFVRGIITTEMNSATDNPLVFCERGEIISGGNFHGEYPAKALDYLAIAVHELGSMSERRTERLINPAYSELPAFLVQDGGLNSGFMLAHCTAAALVSENKVLCHPASVDSVPTSAGTEDHVSMGGFAARKALSVVQNVERVIAIELLCACQAIEFLRPLKTTAPLEAVYKLVRMFVKCWDKDRVMAPDIDAATDLLKQSRIWDTVKPHMDHYFLVQEEETRMPSPTTSEISVGSSGKRRKMDYNNDF